MNNTDFSDPTDNPIGQIALDNFFFILPLALEDGASVEEAVMAAFTAAIKQANDYGNAVELLKDRRMFGGGLEAGVMGGLEDRIGGTASLIYTSSSGIGTNLVRTGQMSGTDYQFNTGHGFYRPHNSNGTTTDLRPTTLTPEFIEDAIAQDLTAFRIAGGHIPTASRGSTTPLKRSVTVENLTIEYTAVMKPNGTISIGTYYGLP